ncbi:outer membrane receptor for ferric coprogen and ferric-rhodotorulic acid [Paucibacter oligotrophus]|uniref:Outer membrane receptor for ferric coprogen and ferric-rhodotorulic acid n=1 Tax=Roseateles oligotrophus TaxID=1769250 RepID=A0A840L6D0_9BURK|nr:TonB-dependent receptor [Roseateles oligotrophus]MBB4843586.1 outer membrane receptor for ferric coprogen and ferric-rhodotorulic acid [Roseateles oligotrophus]
MSPLPPLALVSSKRLLTLAIVCAFAQAGTAVAQSPSVQTINLPAQPLAQSLNALARLSHLELAAPQSLAAGKTAPAISGQLSVEQALKHLLAGSDLVARVDGSLIIVQRAAPPPSATPAVHEARGATAPVNALPAVLVTGSKVRRLEASPSKFDQSLREMPQSVSIISQERIEQQALKTLDDLMLQATGITREQLWLNNNYYSRGLQVKDIRYDDGATSVISDRDNNADAAQFEQVSILRGADGLFGAGDAGGVINLRSKRPQDKLDIKATLSLASWNNYRTELDVTGPLNDDRRLKGRAVAVLQDQDHFFKPSHSRRTMLYGALQLDPSPDTSVVLGSSLQRDRQTAFNASLMRYVDGADAQFPRSTTMGAPWGWLERQNITVYASLVQQLAPGWKLNANARHMSGDDKINGAEMEGSINYTTRQSEWWRYADKTEGSTTLLDVNVQGSFDALGQSHDLIVGLDRNSTIKHYKRNWVVYGSGNAFDRTPPPAWDYPPKGWDSSTRNAGTASAVYGSLRLRPVERLALTLGGRKVFDESQSILNQLNNSRNDFSQKNNFVPYVGAVYELSSEWSAYMSRSEIYQSQLNYFASVNGPSLEPATGKNTEIGIKGELLKGRLNASLAFFDIEKEKEAVYQSWNPTGNNAWCCYVATGSKQSRGVDLELNGRLGPSWDLSLGYTFNNNKNRRADDGRFNTLTPKHLLKVWSNHELSEWWRGFSLGWGLTAQSKSYQAGSVQAYNPATGEFDGAWQNFAFTQKAYAIWSLRAAYELSQQWKLALNMNNVLDHSYYSTIGSSAYGNFYGEPRSLMLTLRGHF